ncbi:MAG: carbapenem self-resistance protein CarG family protein [Rhodanobacteraceae bacterium]
MVFPLLVIVAVCTSTVHAADSSPAASLAKMRVLHLKNGPNHLDFDGDGVPDLIFVARRENFNAHGFTLTTFYTDAKLDEDNDSRMWSVVPLFEKNGKENDSFSTFEGADCILRDMVILRASSKLPVTLVTAERPLGRSFVDVQPVTFTVYRLQRNEDGVFGWPAIYFEESRRIQSAKPYCDVDTAMTRELGIRP